jgi:phosphoribosyl-ATP pyrophosphohydrolase
MEEAFEVCTANTYKDLVFESADVFYFLLALMAREGIDLQDVMDELQRRHFDRSHKSRE